jgi:hypothetical protein
MDDAVRKFIEDELQNRAGFPALSPTGQRIADKVLAAATKKKSSKKK